MSQNDRLHIYRDESYLYDCNYEIIFFSYETMKQFMIVTMKLFFISYVTMKYYTIVTMKLFFISYVTMKYYE